MRILVLGISLPLQILAILTVVDDVCMLLHLPQEVGDRMTGLGYDTPERRTDKLSERQRE